MEINVWMQWFAQAATFVSNLLSSSTAVKKPENPISSPNAQGSVVNSLLISKVSPMDGVGLLKVTRNQKTTDGVFGELKFKGENFCFTMENLALLIPAGQYGLALYNSPHAGHLVPLLKDVPNRNEIEMHCGNVPQDSKGCIIVGDQHIGDTLEASRAAFDRLFPLIKEALAQGPQIIEIVDADILPR